MWFLWGLGCGRWCGETTTEREKGGDRERGGSGRQARGRNTRREPPTTPQNTRQVGAEHEAGPLVGNIVIGRLEVVHQPAQRQLGGACLVMGWEGVGGEGWRRKHVCRQARQARHRRTAHAASARRKSSGKGAASPPQSLFQQAAAAGAARRAAQRARALGKIVRLEIGRAALRLGQTLQVGEVHAVGGAAALADVQHQPAAVIRHLRACVRVWVHKSR